MRIVLVTDAWFPQVNGVVRTLSTMHRILSAWGHELILVTPEGARTLPAPSEPDLRLTIFPGRHFKRVLRESLGDKRPDALHIATEGPLGLAARRWAIRRGWRFTTAFHTMFPDYIQARMGIPASLPWKFMRWFHKPSQRVLAPTQKVVDAIAAQGIARLQVWSRGVDTEKFQPGRRDALPDLPRPIFLNVGRVAKEKNLDAFLSLDLPGSKVVVGGGPDLARLQAKYPAAHFVGVKHDADLLPYYQSADVFVFPSMTDTFGLVMLEAMACGTPVAALRSEAPLDVVKPGAGVLDDDLRHACLAALQCDRNAVRAYALTRTWDVIARDLLFALSPVSAEAQRKLETLRKQEENWLSDAGRWIA